MNHKPLSMNYHSSSFRIGTRGSALALVQTAWVIERLKEQTPGLEVETVVIKTAADRAPDLPLSAMGDKALWVADLEQQLLSGAIDLAVHSMKDVPAVLPPGLSIGAVPERECPLDALVLPDGNGKHHPELCDPEYIGSPIHYRSVQDALSSLLPHGARMGTSSDRRKGQLLLWRPDLRISPVRGNVDTRLRKLDSGDWDALVLAAAGLRRLGKEDRISALFPARRLVPAAGQGALALEIREDDERIQTLIQCIHHGSTAAAVAAERSFVRTVGGGCSIPLGVYTSFPEGCMELWVRAVETELRPGGLPPLQDLEIIELPEENDPFQNLDWAVDFGQTVAERFLSQGGAEFIQHLKDVN